MTNPAGTSDEQKDQRKKLYFLLGLAGLIVIVGGVFVVLPMLTSSNVVKPPPVLTGSPPAGGANTTTSPIAALPAGTGANTTALTTGGTPTGQLASFSSGKKVDPGNNWRVVDPRPDPFRPFYVPTLPPPPPPTPVPPNLDIPEPPVALPNPSGGAPATGAYIPLPPVGVTRNIDPRFVFPPPLNREGDATNLERSTNRRLSGVIIGDRISALLEITGADGQVTTRVVQPGDEVDGIQILRLEKVNANGQDTTRLIVRENGQERVVELRASPNPIGNDGLGGQDGGEGGQGDTFGGRNPQGGGFQGGGFQGGGFGGRGGGFPVPN